MGAIELFRDVMANADDVVVVIVGVLTALGTFVAAASAVVHALEPVAEFLEWAAKTWTPGWDGDDRAVGAFSRGLFWAGWALGQASWSIRWMVEKVQGFVPGRGWR